MRAATAGYTTLLIFVPLVITSWIGVQDFLARCALWIGIWAAVHSAVVPVTEYILTLFPRGRESALYLMIQKVKKQAFETSDMKKLYNMRRLFRSQVYCLFASSTGLYMLYAEYGSNWPMCLLHHWPPTNVFLFELAVANWLFAFYEDAICGDEVTAHMTLLPDEERSMLSTNFRCGLMMHHSVTIFAYAWSLNTHYLGGLCVFGLCFETPVFIMNIRDICAAFDQELGSPYRSVKITTMKLYSYMLQILFHSCRTSFCLLWPLSIIIWRKELATVPLMSRIVYHCLGALFCYVNAVLFVSFLTRYMMDDMVSAMENTAMPPNPSPPITTIL